MVGPICPIRKYVSRWYDTCAVDTIACVALTAVFVFMTSFFLSHRGLLPEKDWDSIWSRTFSCTLRRGIFVELFDLCLYTSYYLFDVQCVVNWSLVFWIRACTHLSMYSSQKLVVGSHDCYGLRVVCFESFIKVF